MIRPITLTAYRARIRLISLEARARSSMSWAMNSGYESLSLPPLSFSYSFQSLLNYSNFLQYVGWNQWIRPSWPSHLLQGVRTNSLQSILKLLTSWAS